MIACIGKNRELGKDGDMPWGRSLPADLKHFKKITKGYTVVMGRKTFESIGKPLPERVNVILTKDKNFKAEGCNVYHTVGEILENEFVEEGNDIYIIGGAEIYKLFMPIANVLYITEVNQTFDADTFFPEFKEEFTLENKEKGIRDEKNDYDFRFCKYKRIRER
jgi:dihydrofolate reductase